LVWAYGEEGCGGLGVTVKVSEYRGAGVGLRRHVKCDKRKYGMQRVEPFNKDKWRSCYGPNRPTRASMEKKKL